MADGDNTNERLGLFDTFSGGATTSGDCVESDDDVGVSENESDFELGSSKQELDSEGTDTESYEVGHLFQNGRFTVAMLISLFVNKLQK